MFNWFRKRHEGPFQPKAEGKSSAQPASSDRNSADPGLPRQGQAAVGLSGVSAESFTVTSEPPLSESTVISGNKPEAAPIDAVTAAADPNIFTSPDPALRSALLQSGSGPKPGSRLESKSGSTPWSKVAWIVGLGTAGSVALIGAATYPLSGLLIRPRQKRVAQLKSPHIKSFIRRLGIKIEDVSFASFDGTQLKGWWMEANPGGPTVAILHGVNRNRTDVVRTAMILGRAGFNILVFDGRGHGHSGGRYVTYGFYERRDVDHALAWLVGDKSVDPALIGLAGESMGAAIALQVAASNPQVRAVWADSPFASLRRIAEEYVRNVTGLPEAVLNPVIWTTIKMANYRGKFDLEMVNPLSIAASINCPVYMVHGTADQLISPDHSEDIYAALLGEKEIWLVEGARHARAVSHSKQEYSDRITRFFKEHLVKDTGAE
jgi:dipeptidyl aminopeptidase/acylaminoacyl peptidase